jgi:hypothetical protein
MVQALQLDQPSNVQDFERVAPLIAGNLELVRVDADVMAHNLVLRRPQLTQSLTNELRHSDQ